MALVPPEADLERVLSMEEQKETVMVRRLRLLVRQALPIRRVPPEPERENFEPPLEQEQTAPLPESLPATHLFFESQCRS